MRLLPGAVAATPRSAGLIISRRPRLGVPARHQAVIFSHDRYESVEAQLLPQAGARRGIAESQEARLQRQNDLVRTIRRGDQKRDWRGIGGRDNPELSGEIGFMAPRQLQRIPGELTEIGTAGKPGFDDTPRRHPRPDALAIEPCTSRPIV